MFDIGWTEILVIAIVAIVVIGPKDLPRAMRAVGQWTARLKRMGREFQGQFNEAMREAELDGVQNEIKSLSKIDPIGTVRRELSSVEADVRAATKLPAKPTDPVTPAVPAAAAAAATVAAPAEPSEAEAPAPPAAAGGAS